ncbi:hypothetical protein [Bacillus cereus]|uniref:hypothetical protein n=1 Tax=Bacillus cereus TaxID=1396 RepID=UPI00027AB9FB|nr:hypothetical protein [Bacillus cereus]EJS68604.1 hypothetical protein ICY_04678 [Bacillus cereus BAG2X1-3]
MITINGFELTMCTGGVDVYINTYDTILPVRHKDIEKFYGQQNLNRMFRIVDREMKKFQLAEMEWGQRQLHRLIYNSLFSNTGYNYLNSAKEFVLGTLVLMNKACDEEDDEKIKFLAQSLLKLMQSYAIFDDVSFLDSYILDTQFAKYEYLHDLRAAELRKQYNQEPTLHAGERILIREIAQSILLEYGFLTDVSGVDYAAIQLYIDASYKLLLSSHIPQDSVPRQLELQHKNDILIDWTLVCDSLAYGKSRLQEGLPVILITFQALNEIHNEFQVISHQYKHLSEETKRKLADVMSAENRYIDSPELIPFSVQTFSMMSVLESELRYIINTVEGKEVVRSLGNIEVYLKEKTLNDFVDQETYNDFVNTLAVLRHIRNKGAHGNEVNLEEYQQVKDFTFNSGILTSISLYNKKLGLNI